jgi:hypothetical protein
MLQRLLFYYLTSLFFLGLTETRAQIDQTDHWETLIYPYQTWQYLPAVSEPPSNWNELNFDDSQWETGPGGIGYADGDDSTQIQPAISIYMRMKFNLVDTSNITDMLFYIDFDDAFIAYINGTEIARHNITGINPAYNTEANSPREATMYTGGLPQEFQIPASNLKNIINSGENVLALQVHNRSISSSDLSAIPFLLVGIKDSSITYQDTPEWFISPLDFYSSHLPIVSINTLGNTILDEPRIKAEMGIIDHGPGNVNHKSDSFNDFHGWISIEIRGESAQMFPKKSYSFETQDSLGENRNVSLMGLPEENDWILYAPYSDKTLIKNVLTYKLTRDMGRYATRTKYCELFIDGSYKGLYVLMEKIKQDKNRVDISKLRPEDIEGDQLTGGYLLRVDKVDNNDFPAFIAFPNVSIPGEEPVRLQYFDPQGEDLHVEQQVYIRDYIRQFEQALNLSSYLSYFIGYHEYIDKDALVDYIIINEISKNIDAYIFSTYMYKDRDSKGGKLTMGPVWDFNIAYGNVDYNSAAETERGWMYDEGYRMYWIRRMMTDPALRNKMSCRWHELRSNVFSDGVIFGYIDSLVVSLQEPIRDNFRRWPVLGQYVWPNSFIGNTHEEEISFLKNWLYDRLHWMDNNIDESCVESLDPNSETDLELEIFPNPFSDEVYIEYNSKNNFIRQLAVYEVSGSMLWMDEFEEHQSKRIKWSGSGPKSPHLSKGIYLLQLTFSDGAQVTRKIIKN